MMRLWHYRLLLILSLSLISVQALAQILEQTFSDSVAQFKISTPNPRWFLAPRSVTPGPTRATLRFEVPVYQFVPTVTVRVLPLVKEKTTLDPWIEADLKDLPDNIIVEKKEKIKHKGREGYEIWFREKGSDLKFQQWVFLAEGKSYVITCAAKTPSFPRFAEEFKKILNSFEIL